MQLSELCNHEVVQISKSDSVLNAAKLLRNEHVGCLVVTDNKEGTSKPVGIVTDRDIVIKALAQNADTQTTRIDDVITSKFITANVHDDPHTALDLMRKHGIRRVPVVNDDGMLEGIVTVDDLFAFLGEELHRLSRAIYMEQSREKLLEAKIA